MLYRCRLALIIVFLPLAATVTMACIVQAEEPTRARETISPEEAIRRALAKPVKLSFEDAPLSEVVKQLRQQLSVQVYLDRKALTDVGIGPDDPVTFEISEISARSALNLMLRDLDLTCTIADEVLRITTPEEANNTFETTVYDVADLVVHEGADEDQPDFDSLIQMITAIIQPTTWDSVGGPGSIRPFHAPGIKVIIVSQTQDVRGELASLLADLRSVRRAKPVTEEADNKARPLLPVPAKRDEPKGAQAQEPTPTLRPRESPRYAAVDKAIKEALARHVDLDFEKRPLTEVVEWLNKNADMRVELDRRALTNVGVEAATTLITVHVSGVMLRSALDLILREPGLAWAIRDEKLLLTSEDEAALSLVTRVYDVSDLPSFRDEHSKPVPDFDALIAAITGSVAPDTWAKAGGPGSIVACNTSELQALVVSHTWPTHERIEDLLSQVRKSRSEKGLQLNPKSLPLLSMRPQDYSSATARTPRARTSRPARPPALAEDPKRDIVVKGNNEFAFDLYTKLREGQKGNIFFSPASISTALAMTYAGVRGKTAEEMARAAHFTLPPAELHPAFAALQAALPGKEDGDCELHIANRLWCQQDHKVLDEFLRTTRQHYGAECGLLDFREKENASRTISTWIEQHTAGKIKDLVRPDMFNPVFPTTLVLTNAISFKGRWADPFHETRAGVFYCGSEKIPVSMMYGRRVCRYGGADDLEILEQPYAGGAAAMLILLPSRHADGLAGLEASLTAEQLRVLRSRLTSQQVDVFLPKFRLESQYELAGQLRSLGMSSAFDVGEADFSGMDGSGSLYLQSIIHKGLIGVDELGTEAAAATGALGGLGMSAAESRVPIFIADHPFLFLLCEIRTGAILFIGRLTEPEAARIPRERGDGTGMF